MGGMTPVERAREDVRVFADLIGHPLTAVQAAALALESWLTAIVGVRQSGKSRSLSILAAWAAFRRARTRVLVISSGEDGAKRLLGEVRGIVTGSPLLSASLVDESASLIVLSNGSEIRSVPASERQVRGWSVDLLILDEAALISDDLVQAAIPTTAARPDARVVAASTPRASTGWFYETALAGMGEPSERVRTFRWSVEDAPWISRSAIEHARATLPANRFAAEYLAEFTSAVDAYFDQADILAAVADYRMLDPSDAEGEAIALGIDWSGLRYDPHAVVGIGVLDDHNANDAPVLFVPWAETSMRPYSEQIEVIVGMARPRSSRLRFWRGESEIPVHRLPNGGRSWEGRDGVAAFIASQQAKDRPRRGGYEIVKVLAEASGVGSMPVEQLTARMGRRIVESIYTSQRSKADAYGRLRVLFTQHRLVIPNHRELIAQLLGMRSEVTAGGGLSIEASSAAVHDDLADGASLAISALPPDLDPGIATSAPPGIEYLETPGGVLVPRHPRPRRGSLGAVRGRVHAWM